MGDLTQLMSEASAGVDGARDRLFEVAYRDLKKLARSRLRDGGRNTCLDTTALVHESYTRFVNGGQLRSEDRRAFFAYSSAVMRSVIIDAVRERQSQRRGGNLMELTLNTEIESSVPAGEEQILGVHEALEELAKVEPRMAKVVEMRYFGGYSDIEIAEAMGLTDRTVRRDWERARLLLAVALRQ